MGHADIQTTMIYPHHQPKVAAAAELTRLVEQAIMPGAAPAVLAEDARENVPVGGGRL
jgi:hypothetical protein